MTRVVSASYIPEYLKKSFWEGSSMTWPEAGRIAPTRNLTSEGCLELLHTAFSGIDAIDGESLEATSRSPPFSILCSASCNIATTDTIHFLSGFPRATA